MDGKERGRSDKGRPRERERGERRGLLVAAVPSGDGAQCVGVLEDVVDAAYLLVEYDGDGRHEGGGVERGDRVGERDGLSLGGFGEGGEVAQRERGPHVSGSVGGSVVIIAVGEGEVGNGTDEEDKPVVGGTRRRSDMLGRGERRHGEGDGRSGTRGGDRREEK